MSKVGHSKSTTAAACSALLAAWMLYAGSLSAGAAQAANDRAAGGDGTDGAVAQVAREVDRCAPVPRFIETTPRAFFLAVLDDDDNDDDDDDDDGGGEPNGRSWVLPAPAPREATAPDVYIAATTESSGQPALLRQAPKTSPPAVG